MIDIKSQRVEFESILNHLKEELRGVRTGRAHSSIVENLMVDSYGTQTPLKHIASISIPDSRTILISPWDASVLKEIEKAISYADIGAQPLNDGTSVRIVLPTLTEENRKSLTKVVGQKQEHAKVSIRLLRDKIREEIQKSEKQKEITEDDRFALQKELDEVTKEYGASIDEAAEEKEKDIMTL